jgi:4-hydroxybenzoate polyprenyltransferase
MKIGEDKLGFGIGTSVLMLVGWLMTARWPALQPGLATVIGGLTGVFAIFCGAHVGNKWVDSKADKDDAPDPQPDPQPNLAEGEGGK